jgi:hypothetical protein
VRAEEVAVVVDAPPACSLAVAEVLADEVSVASLGALEVSAVSGAAEVLGVGLFFAHLKFRKTRRACGRLRCKAARLFSFSFKFSLPMR